jgi:hypothetical protein
VQVQVQASTSKHELMVDVCYPAPLRSAPLYSTRLCAPLPEIRTLLPSAPCSGLCFGAGGCEAVGLDWTGLRTFIRYMAGLQAQPMGMYGSATSGG